MALCRDPNQKISQARAEIKDEESSARLGREECQYPSSAAPSEHNFHEQLWPLFLHTMCSLNRPPEGTPVREQHETAPPSSQPLPREPHISIVNATNQVGRDDGEVLTTFHWQQKTLAGQGKGLERKSQRPDLLDQHGQILDKSQSLSDTGALSGKHFLPHKLSG